MVEIKNKELSEEHKRKIANEFGEVEDLKKW